MIGTSDQAKLTMHPVVDLLLTLAAAADRALDNSEECQGDDGERVHVLDSDGFDAVSDALDALDDLPDDQPGLTMGPAAKARWALRAYTSSIEHEVDGIDEVEFAGHVVGPGGALVHIGDLKRDDTPLETSESDAIEVKP